MPFDSASTAAAIRTRLEPLGTTDRAVNEKRYLKSELEFLGVKVPLVRKEARAWLRENPELEREELLALADELWGRGVHELRSFAIDLAIFRLESLEQGDLRTVERWLREAKTWAHVDALAVQLVGKLLERFPGVARTLDRWSHDDDFWIRRSAMLALLLGLRQGGGDWDRFSAYADRMLEENEFFIRKAIGWILRETAKKRPEIVYEFLRGRIDRVSGLTLREGSRSLEPARQQELKAAYEAR